MLPRLKRLNLKKDFKWVASGQKVETKYLKIFIKLGDNQMFRVGIAVSGKNFKKASERNKVRRQVSGVFETLYLSLLPGINIVALPKMSIIGVKSQDVLLDLKEGLRNMLKQVDIK